MKAAAISLMCIGLFVLINKAHALRSHQRKNFDDWFEHTKDVIQPKTLVAYLLDNGFEGMTKAQLEDLVKDMDKNKDGIDLQELMANPQVTEFIQSKNGKSIETFFKKEKNAISKTTFKELLDKTKWYTTQAKVDEVYNSIDTDGDGTINYHELLNPQVELVVIKVADL